MPIRTNRGRAAVYRKLWGWPMRSPRHLTVFLVVIGMVVLVVGLLVPKVTGAGGSSAAGSGGLSSSATTSTSGVPDGGAGTGADRDQPSSGSSTALPTRLPAPPASPTSAAPAPEALRIAEQWGKAWVNHPEGISTEQWLTGLRPFTTEEYIAVMATVDPANIPATEVTGPPEARQSFTSSVEVTLPTNGPRIAMTVISTPQGWRVAHYEQVT